MTTEPGSGAGEHEPDDTQTLREAEALEDGSLDPDELTDEPDWWDEGSDDET